MSKSDVGGPKTIKEIVVLTQDQYNALTPDPNTFYIIIN